jgi:hypothetical protein
VSRELVRCALLLLGAALPVAGQAVVVRDAGPGLAHRFIEAALLTPHTVFTPDSKPATIARDSTLASGALILARDAQIAGHVRGDVVVVGGDLNLRPGARIDGRAVAIGGGVYQSSVDVVTGEQVSFRDLTYDVRQTGDDYALYYRSLIVDYAEPVSWGLFHGLRSPGYDRSDGLSLPVGPTVALADSRLELRPRITYRSQLGVVDPEASADFQLNRRTSFRASVARSTFSNDAWILSNPVNGASALVFGADTRNYFRADRGEITAHRLWERVALEIEPYVGARWERASSTRPDSIVAGGPWSLFGRRSSDHMLRPNPPVDDGTIPSLLGGARLAWGSEALRSSVTVGEEITFTSPRAGGFAQTTIDGGLIVPTLGAQRYKLDAHLVLTVGGAPRQRWAFLGGIGTIPMLSLLEQGGDQLIFLDSRYEIPLLRFARPPLGVPVLSLRHVLGAAGAGTLPHLEQRVGLRGSWSFVRAEFLVDPARPAGELSIGASFVR